MSGDWDEDLCNKALVLAEELCFRSPGGYSQNERCQELSDILRGRHRQIDTAEGPDTGRSTQSGEGQGAGLKAEEGRAGGERDRRKLQAVGSTWGNAQSCQSEGPGPEAPEKAKLLPPRPRELLNNAAVSARRHRCAPRERPSAALNRNKDQYRRRRPRKQPRCAYPSEGPAPVYPPRVSPLREHGVSTLGRPSVNVFINRRLMAELKSRWAQLASA
ncbi:hypothetical protein COCON_G00202350 [Conger conger]|uniref:Uncharacterized protein n=1 Tax=Conger conger TaxID=82655 RepID=A0A9Q1CZG4_CONCO|nr:hypothetical protein COCON_G00202350 [Conger conger]